MIDCGRGRRFNEGNVKGEHGSRPWTIDHGP